MGILRQMFTRSSKVETPEPRPQAMASAPLEAPQREPGWYVPQDGNLDRFVGVHGVPSLHLISYTSGGETVLRLCEDSTGLLVGPTDRRLPRAGIWVSQLRGEQYYARACRLGDFSPGATVRLVREPANPHDTNAIAVYDATGQYMAAYFNRGKARMLAKRLDAGEPVAAISIRGARGGQVCDQVAVLAAHPNVLTTLLAERSRSLPPPAHQRLH